VRPRWWSTWSHDSRKGRDDEVSVALRARLRGDFQLSIITLFGATSVAGIFPFAVYRALTGAYAVALLDAALILLISALTAYAWHSRDTRGASVALVLIYTAGAVASAELLGVAGLFWMYAVILANFFLVRAALAWIVVVAALAALIVFRSGLSDMGQLVSFVATAVLVSGLAHILADRVAAQRHELQQLAAHDPLTGVHNRRAMAEELARAVEAHRRDALPVALLLFDLDHFKRINDAYGHDVGDTVLRDFCRVLLSGVRAVDRVFRYGGEEFVLLLPGVELGRLQALGDKLRLLIAAELKSPGGAVTVSGGGAALHGGEHWEHWLARADDALYRAKAAGRDRIEIDRAG
jgi:diguanylate cyclase (GGDEF)-like protein